MHKIDIGKKINLHVEDWGAGKQIVFVHGLPFDHRIFDYQMMVLAKRDYRVIGIDLRGFGQSDRPWTGNDYDTWASDVARVIAVLNLRDVTLVGFSIGGAIVAHHLARFRDTRVSKLALLAAPLPSLSQAQEKKTLDGFMQDALVDQAKFARDFIEKMLNTPASPEYIQRLVHMGTTTSLRAFLRALEELRDRDLKPEIPNIKIPTRIFHGVHDKIVPFSLAQEQQQIIKDAALVPFENSGHALFWDEKDKLADELAKFASETSAKVAA